MHGVSPYAAIVACKAICYLDCVPGKRALLADADYAVSVSGYSPNERQAPHTDAFSRISLLLRGGCREETRAGAVRMQPGDVLFKSRRIRHETYFCGKGAAFVSLDFLRHDPFEGPASGGIWERRTDMHALYLALALLEAALAGDTSGLHAAAADLAASHDERPCVVASAPPWLAQLREELDERGLADIDINARARNAGVHPAHASRLFRRCYGMSITEHANGQRIRRALRGLASSQSALSEIATEAGFYDQSHMNRAFRRTLGRSPGAQRALIAAAG